MPVRPFSAQLDKQPDEEKKETAPSQGKLVKLNLNLNNRKKGKAKVQAKKPAVQEKKSNFASLDLCLDVLKYE